MEKYVVLGRWYSSGIGMVEDGQVLELDPFLGDQFISRGYVRHYEIKPEPVHPLVSGPENDATLSPPVQAVPRRRRSKKYSTKDDG